MVRDSVRGELLHFLLFRPTDYRGWDALACGEIRRRSVAAPFMKGFE